MTRTLTRGKASTWDRNPTKGLINIAKKNFKSLRYDGTHVMSKIVLWEMTWLILHLTKQTKTC